MAREATCLSRQTRLSVGVEAVADLIADLKAALGLSGGRALPGLGPTRR